MTKFRTELNQNAFNTLSEGKPFSTTVEAETANVTRSNLIATMKKAGIDVTSQYDSSSGTVTIWPKAGAPTIRRIRKANQETSQLRILKGQFPVEVIPVSEVDSGPGEKYAWMVEPLQRAAQNNEAVKMTLTPETARAISPIRKMMRKRGMRINVITNKKTNKVFIKPVS